MGGRSQPEAVPAARQNLVGFEPTHTSTKLVRALEIVALDDLSLGYLDVRMPDGTVRQVNVPRDLARRGTPVPGDRLIIYRDGYVSWCPKAVFEGGEYRAVGVAANPAVPHLAGLTFGEALEALKAGARICRAGWNGKSMWLALSGPLQGREIPAESFWSLHNAEFARRNGGSATVLPCITMKTATGEILMGWLASQTDMLADDWMLVEHGGASIEETPRVPRFEGAASVEVVPPAA